MCKRNVMSKEDREMSKAMSGANMAVQSFVDHVVEFVFGYPGRAFLPLSDVL